MTEPKALPKTLKEFFEFYETFFKPLHNDRLKPSEQCQELLIEIHAAFNHLAGKWLHDEEEKKCVESASGHLKRATFDIYKLIVKETFLRCKDLHAVDTSIIDQGNFNKNLIKLIAELKASVHVARKAEGNSRLNHNWGEAFVKWNIAYTLCERIDITIENNTRNIKWARRKQWAKVWFRRVGSIIVGFLGVFALNLIRLAFYP